MKKLLALSLLIVLVLGQFALSQAASGPGESMPVGQSGPNIPRLDESQLQGLVSQVTFLPISYQDSPATTYAETLDESLKDLEAFWSAASDRISEVGQRFGWERINGIQYDTCIPDRAIGKLYLEVSQLSSPEAARAFIDDYAVRGIVEVGYGDMIRESTLVHGWYMVLPDTMTDTSCFEKEEHYTLVFEYWGLLYSLEADVQSGTDPALPLDMLDTLAAQLIQKVDSLYQTTSAPTPAPAGLQGSLTADLTLDNLARVLPDENFMRSDEENYFVINRDVSRVYTLAEYVGAYQSLNMPALATALNEAGTTHGMLGQGVLLWEPRETCPSIVGLSMEIDLALFETPDGPVGFMNDATYQQAWLATGMLSSFAPQPDGTMLVYGSLPNYHCGPARIVEKMVPLDRVLITIALTTYQDVPEADAMNIINSMEFMTKAKLKLFAPE